MRRSQLLIAAITVAVASCHKAPPDESVRRNNDGANTGGSGVGDPGNDGTRGDGGDGQGTGGANRDGGNDSAGGSGSNGGSGNGSGGDGPAGGNAGEPGGIPDAGTLPTPAFTKRNLLKASADCALVHYHAFKTHAEALAEATRAYADDTDADHLAVARDAWRAAIASFERVELFRFGPAARRMHDPNGQDLRDEIYIFPQANPCRVDQQIVNRAYAAGSFASTLSSGRGLSAIEYLLFYAGSTNACSSSIDINFDGTWAPLSAAELQERRADYAAAAAADVVERISQLIDAWDPDARNFYAQLTDPRNGTAYATDQDALNAVSDALFYVENEVKDLKLGWPLGLVPDCFNSPDPCPADVESRYARVSTDHLRQNLRGYRALFQGCGASDSGLGFDDWLHEVGAGDLSDRMLAELAGAEQAVDTLDPPIEDALVSDIAKVRAVHAAIKRLTDLMKSEFPTVLNLELPEGAIGDND